MTAQMCNPDSMTIEIRKGNNFFKSTTQHLISLE